MTIHIEPEVLFTLTLFVLLGQFYVLSCFAPDITVNYNLIALVRRSEVRNFDVVIVEALSASSWLIML